MELWIRSQNKGALIKVEILGNTEGTINAYSNDNKIVLGEYSSDERALEVLDEIQNIMSAKCILKSYDNITPDYSDNLVIQPCEVKIEQLETYVYEMPND